MSESFLSDLQHVFCHECFERMQRAKVILDKSDMSTEASDCLDQLHQEFDSLVGASRALNYDVLENFSRLMASYCRYLRNRLPEPVIPKHAELLYKAVDLWLGCNGKKQHCLSTRDAEVNEVAEEIERAMNLDAWQF